MQIERLASLPEKHDAVRAAAEYGYLTMGARFPNFVYNLFYATADIDPIILDQSVKTIPLETVRGRLAVRNNNVNVLAKVSTADDLAAIEAGLICALGGENIEVASLIDESVAEPFYSTYAISQMGQSFHTPVASSGLLDLDKVLSEENRSLLLVSPPNAIPRDIAEGRFGFRWEISLFLNRFPMWRIGAVESITKMT